MKNNKKSYEYRLTNTTMKPTSFKFQWQVVKRPYIGYDAAKDEMKNDQKSKQLLDKYEADTLLPDEEKAFYKIFVKKIEKHSKPYFKYVLVRKCEDFAKIVDAIKDIASSKHVDVMDVMDSNENVKLFKERIAEESKKNRTFSSLSNMQKWIEKNGLDIDAYELWNAGKAA